MAAGGKFRSRIVRELWRQFKLTAVGIILPLWALFKSAFRQLRVFSKSYIVMGYFLYWSWKSEIKHYLRFSAVVILIISVVLPVLEMFLHMLHEYWLAEGVAATRRGVTFLTIYLAGVAFVVWHNRTELKKPEYEYTFVRRLRAILQDARTSSSAIPRTAKDVLEICHSAFEHVGISHVSIAWKTGDAIRIAPGHVYPKDDWNSYYHALELKLGEGVAGLVCLDGHVRYVPRLFWPMASYTQVHLCVTTLHLPMLDFPHAIKFGFDETADPGERWRKSQLTEEMPDYGCVKTTNWAPNQRQRELPFRSFLSVPLKPRNGDLVGVLNLDFSRVDPLSKPEIEMALIFGLTIADEIG
jgi:hypothetical protein